MRKQILKYIEKKSKVDLGELAILLGTDEVTVANEIAEMEKEKENTAPINKISTRDIKDYINECKKIARDNGKDCLALVAGDIHREMKLKSAMPMVCNAMRQCMDIEDIVLYETASGYSSTLKIEYKL